MSKEKQTGMQDLEKYFPHKFLIHTLNNPITIFDGKKNKFAYINIHFSHLTGYSPEELAHLNVEEFLSHIHAKDLLVFVNEALVKLHDVCIKYVKDKKHQVSYTHNYRIRHKAGHYIHVLVQNTVLKWNHAENKSTVLSLYTDVSHLKHDPVMHLSINAFDPANGTHTTIFKEEFRPHPQMLSNREAEIMKLIVKGLSAGEISKVLNMNYHTVRSHWRNTMIKTKCNSKEELRLLALKEGWI